MISNIRGPTAGGNRSVNAGLSSHIPTRTHRLDDPPAKAEDGI